MALKAQKRGGSDAKRKPHSLSTLANASCFIKRKAALGSQNMISRIDLAKKKASAFIKKQRLQ